MIEVNLIEPRASQMEISAFARLVIIPRSWEPKERPMVALMVRTGQTTYYTAKRVAGMFFREN